MFIANRPYGVVYTPNKRQ